MAEEATEAVMVAEEAKRATTEEESLEVEEATTEETMVEEEVAAMVHCYECQSRDSTCWLC